MESLERNYKEFVNFVIKRLIADITTETSVTLEFMDQLDRESFTSSPCNFAKSEEISELMEDAYPVTANSDERANHVQTDRMSTTSTDRLIDSN